MAEHLRRLRRLTRLWRRPSGTAPEYQGSLRRDDLAADPFEQFDAWFAEAAPQVPGAEAMALATVDASGAPAVRFVLLKGLGPDGFDFYTDYRSDKSEQLSADNRAALAFWWRLLGRQVRASGSVKRLDEAESDDYFRTRPREAQLGAWASEQSAPLQDRAELTGQVEEATQRFQGREVDRPPHWGGFRLVPDEIEFWQQGEARLHDRFRYRRQPDGGWSIERLSP
jgi:pyridoxamine 5'-phosphate oxidase